MLLINSPVNYHLSTNCHSERLTCLEQVEQLCWCEAWRAGARNKPKDLIPGSVPVLSRHQILRLRSGWQSKWFHSRE